MNNYSPLQISLHWVVAILVLGLFGSGFWMVDLTYYSAWYRSAPFWHKSVGVLLALLVVIRLGVRFSSSPVTPLKTHSQAVVRLSHAVHAILYLLLIALVLSGYLISTADGRGIDVAGLFQLPSFGELFAEQSDKAGKIHKYVAYSLMGLVGVHALAALKHHVIDKDLTLKRMLTSKLNKERRE